MKERKGEGESERERERIIPRKWVSVSRLGQTSNRPNVCSLSSDVFHFYFIKSVESSMWLWFLFSLLYLRLLLLLPSLFILLFFFLFFFPFLLFFFFFFFFSLFRSYFSKNLICYLTVRSHFIFVFSKKLYNAKVTVLI